MAIDKANIMQLNESIRHIEEAMFCFQFTENLNKERQVRAGSYLEKARVECEKMLEEEQNK